MAAMHNDSTRDTAAAPPATAGAHARAADHAHILHRSGMNKEQIQPGATSRWVP